MALVPVSGVVTVSETDKTKPVYYQLLHQPPYNKTQDTNCWYQLSTRPARIGTNLINKYKRHNHPYSKKDFNSNKML